LVCFLYLLIKETHLEVDVFALGGILRELWLIKRDLVECIQWVCGLADVLFEVIPLSQCFFEDGGLDFLLWKFLTVC
jgi:hypothetical protein